MSSPFRSVLFFGLAILVLTTTSAGQPPTSQPAARVALRNTRWQVLPPQVTDVFIGPDDRAWYVVGKPDDLMSLDDCRALIAREFAQPAPMLAGLRPALFERPPSRRVWFHRAGRPLAARV